MACLRGFTSRFLHRWNHKFYLGIRHKSITGYQTADTALTTVTGGKIYRWIDAYEDFVGLTEVRNAQETVTKAEVNYRHVQEERRAAQQQLATVHQKIKTIAMDIEKTQRGTDAYLELVTKENEVIKEEKQVLEELNVLEEDEKEKFSYLSSALRESHEKERARAERMKYWGLIGSVVGAVLGIFGTTVNNYLRMRELRNIMKTSASLNDEYREQTLELCQNVSKQYDTLFTALNGLQIQSGNNPAKVDKVVGKRKQADISVETKLSDLVSVVKSQEEVLRSEIQEVRKVLASQQAVGHNVEGGVVYVGQEFETMLKETEKNLEFKMKLQALGTVTLAYAAAAVTLPLLFYLFGGGGGGS